MLVVHKLGCRADKHLGRFFLAHRDIALDVQSVIHAHQMPKILVGLGKHDALNLARAILYGKEGHTLIILGGLDGH